jgi:hypothetical protein
MAFIGTPLDTRNTFQSLVGKRFSGDGSTTAFTLDVAPGNVLDIEVFVGNVRQDPNSAYTLSGTTLTFTGAPPSGTNNIYVVHQAKSVGTIDVPSGGVKADNLNSAVLTGQTDIGGAIADADLFLVDDGAGGTLRKVAASRIKTYAATTSATDSFSITGSTPTLTIGDAGAEDTKIVFDGNAQDYYIALDDSADDLILGKGSTVGTTPIISMADDGDTKITSTSTATGDAALELHSTGNSNGNYTNLKFTSAGNTTGTFIKSNQAGSSNAGRFEFWVNNDGTSQEGMRIAYNGYLKCAGVYNQSAGDSANVVVDGSGNIYRSTSALKYKQDVRDLESIDISSFRPVRYKSKSPKDDPKKDFIGFIADEFHDAGLTELVFYGNDSDGKPTVVEGFNYDRLTVILTKALQEANAKIATLEAKVKALEEA